MIKSFGWTTQNEQIRLMFQLHQAKLENELRVEHQKLLREQCIQIREECRKTREKSQKARKG